MSVESMAIALHHSRAKGTAKVVLLGIANHDGDGGAFPKVATLAKYANVHPRRVVEALNTLGQLGEVVIHQKSGGTARMPEHQRPNLYEFVLECPADCDRSKHHRIPGDQRGRNYAGQQDPKRVKDPAAVARGKAARAKHLANLAAIAQTVLPDVNSTTPSVENDTTPSVENDTTKNHPLEPPVEIPFVGTSPEGGSICWTCGKQHATDARYCTSCTNNGMASPWITCTGCDVVRKRNRPGQQSFTCKNCKP